MNEPRQLLVFARIFRMLATMFGALLLAGLVTALLAPFLGLPALGWAFMSTMDWDGTTTAEVLMFLVLTLPMLAPLPISFVGFWKWLAVETAPQPAAVARSVLQYDAFDHAARNARLSLGMAPASDVLDGLGQLRARATALEHAEATLEQRLTDVRGQLRDIDRLADDTGRRLSRTQTEAMLTDLHARLDDAIRASREVDGELLRRRVAS